MEKRLELLLSPEAIAKQIKVYAAKLDEIYQGKSLVCIVILKGALCLMADLMRQLHVPCSFEMVFASSYGMRGTSRGQLSVSGIQKLDLTGKNVLVLDDIFDSGYTLSAVVEEVLQKKPETVESLVLLLKDTTRTVDYLPTHHLFTVPDRFVVGYGLDYKECYRELPGIYGFVDNIPICSGDKSLGRGR